MAISIIQQANRFLKETDAGNAIVSVFDNTGIAGFVFNVPRMEQVRLSNEITDYYSDNNTVFNDHIARKPVTVTVSGLQGEYFYSKHQIRDMISTVASTLKSVEGFKPQFTSAENQLRTKWDNYQKQIETINESRLTNYDLYNPTTYTNLTLKEKFNVFTKKFTTYNGVDLFTLFQNLYKFKSAQTRAYLFFETLRKADKPFTVETRWKRFENMYIQDVTATGDETADYTEFQVTFKQTYFTSSQVLNINAAGRTQQQYWKETNKGLDKGTKVETI